MKFSWPDSVRVLGAAGLTAALLGMIGGFADVPALLGAANLMMLAANVYCVCRGK